jgi:hypothetical protein
MKGAHTLMSPLFNLLHLSAKSVEKKERVLTGSALPVLFMFCLYLFRISRKPKKFWCGKNPKCKHKGQYLCTVICNKVFKIFFALSIYTVFMFHILKRCMCTETIVVWGVCVLIKWNLKLLFDNDTWHWRGIVPE